MILSSNDYFRWPISLLRSHANVLGAFDAPAIPYYPMHGETQHLAHSVSSYTHTAACTTCCYIAYATHNMRHTLTFPPRGRSRTHMHTPMTLAHNGVVVAMRLLNAQNAVHSDNYNYVGIYRNAHACTMHMTHISEQPRREYCMYVHPTCLTLAANESLYLSPYPMAYSQNYSVACTSTSHGLRKTTHAAHKTKLQRARPHKHNTDEHTSHPWRIWKHKLVTTPYTSIAREEHTKNTHLKRDRWQQTEHTRRERRTIPSIKQPQHKHNTHHDGCLWR